MDEFLILLQAKLDEAKSKGNVNADIEKLQNQLNKLKVQVEIDPKATQKLANDIGKLVNQKIIISNIGINQNNLSKTGQQIGQVILDGAEKAIGDVTSKVIGKGFTVSSAMSKKVQSELESIVKDWTNNKGKVNSITIDTKTDFNEKTLENIEQLKSATVQYSNELGQVITKTLKYKQVGVNTFANGETEAIKGWVESASTYKATLESTSKSTNNFVAQQKKAVTDLTSQVNQIYKSAIDQNASKPIKDSTNLSNLENKYNDIITAIGKMGNASEVAFTDERNSVNTLISDLKIVVKEYKNAETAATSMRSKDVGTIKSVKTNELDEFIAKIQNSKVPIKEMRSEIANLKTSLSNIHDTDTLTAYLNQFDIANSKFKSLKEQFAKSESLSSVIFNPVDLEKQGKVYIQRVRNTIEAIKPELESKLRNAGYSDIEIKGVENAKGKIKSLTATVTDATGAFKQLNFERAKIQGSNQINHGFIQTDDVKVIGNISSEIGKVQNSLSTLKTKWEEQGVLVGEFKTKVEQLESSLSSVGNKGELDGLKTQIQDLKNEASTLSHIHEIQLSMDNDHGASKYQNRIQSLINDFQKYGIAAETAKTQTESLQQILDNMKGMSGQELVTQANKFEQEFKAVKISVDEAKLSYDKLLQPISSTQQINLTNKIEKWLVNNTRATSKARSELQLYLKELESGQVTNGRYTEISNAFTTIDTQMRSMNKLGKSLFQSLSDGAKKFTSWISATAIVMRAITTVRTGIKVVKELDTALVDLKKTANMSARELIGFYHSANDTAKQMGVTTKEIIEQAAAWSRLGFSTADAATKMAKYSSMFATISPGMNLDSATDGLVSVMKAFKIGLENTDEVVDGIMSKINIIGNTQAVNNSDIVDFLRRSSSAMAEANNTLEDTIALGTAMVEITRDAAGAGQVLKTVSMRVRGYDEETEEFIGGVEELSGKIADLTKTASTPGGISLFTDDAKTEFKSTRQLLQEISEIYDQLNDKTQAELLEALAGKRNGQAVSAILNNFDTVTQSLESMSNSAGNAEAEMAIAMDSIDYKLNRVKETGTGIAQNLFGQEDMKLILDAIGSIGNGIDWLTNKLNLFGTIGVGGLGIGITQFVKSFD